MKIIYSLITILILLILMPFIILPFEYKEKKEWRFAITFKSVLYIIAIAITFILGILIKS